MHQITTVSSLRFDLNYWCTGSQSLFFFFSYVNEVFGCPSLSDVVWLSCDYSK